jgi:hypothetical protein
LAAAGDLRLAVGGVDALQLGAGGVSGNLNLVSAGQGNVSATATNATLALSGNRSAADPNVDVYIQNPNANRTAGYIADFRHAGGDRLLVDYQGLVRLAAAAAAIQPAALWTAITPNANWTAGGGLAYWKDATGVVRLKGFLTVGAGAANPIFTLPAGFRPSQNRYFAIADPNPAAGAVTAFVQTDGQVLMNTAITTGHLLYVDSVAFLAEA